MIRVLEDGPASGVRNMAVDEALMAAARRGTVTLRFYGWDPPCLSLGRNERARAVYDAAEAARRGVDIVRRPTGGRAVYHHDEITYSVTAPVEAWGGLRESYGRINRALARGLRALRAPVEAAGDGPGGSPGLGPAAPACFRDPVAGEVVARGRKLAGSAQWREDGALLQHGSILLTDQQALVARLRGSGGSGDSTRSGAAGAVSGAVGLVELTGSRPDGAELIASLRGGFEAELGCALVSGRLSPPEEETARRLEARYRSPDWTWRR